MSKEFRTLVREAAERLQPGAGRRACEEGRTALRPNRYAGMPGVLHRFKRYVDSVPRSREAANAWAKSQPWFKRAKYAGCDARYFLWFEAA
jgi:hypothetical protein